MNLAIESVTPAPAAPRPDARDHLILFLVAGGFIASWVYVFMHPSTEAFGICVAAVGTFTAAFHALSVHDDKTVDRKEG